MGYAIGPNPRVEGCGVWGGVPGVVGKIGHPAPKVHPLWGQVHPPVYKYHQVAGEIDRPTPKVRLLEGEVYPLVCQRRLVVCQVDPLYPPTPTGSRVGIYPLLP